MLNVIRIASATSDPEAAFGNLVLCFFIPVKPNLFFIELFAGILARRAPAASRNIVQIALLVMRHRHNFVQPRNRKGTRPAKVDDRLFLLMQFRSNRRNLGCQSLGNRQDSVTVAMQ